MYAKETRQANTCQPGFYCGIHRSWAKFAKHRMRGLRKLKGYSQEELTDRANLYRMYIGVIERSEQNVSIDNIDKIAKVLGIYEKSDFYFRKPYS